MYSFPAEWLRVMEQCEVLGVIRNYQIQTKYISEICMDHPGTSRGRPTQDPAGRLQQGPPQYI